LHDYLPLIPIFYHIDLSNTTLRLVKIVYSISDEDSGIDINDEYEELEELLLWQELNKPYIVRKELRR